MNTANIYFRPSTAYKYYFYNAVICSIIVYGSVCWSGNISKFDRGRMEKIVKKASHVVEMPLDSFNTP